MRRLKQTNFVRVLQFGDGDGEGIVGEGERSIGVKEGGMVAAKASGVVSKRSAGRNRASEGGMGMVVVVGMMMLIIYNGSPKER